MSFVGKALPIALAATALVAACSDISSPTQTLSAPETALARKGGASGGRADTSITQLVVTTPPTVDATGTWIGTTDGPDVVHSYTYTLQQTSVGIVSGSGVVTTPTTTTSYLIAGTVNGDTLMLYTGPGTVCSSCTLDPLYRGIITHHSSRVEGSFVSGGSPLILNKQ